MEFWIGLHFIVVLSRNKTNILFTPVLSSVGLAWVRLEEILSLFSRGDENQTELLRSRQEARRDRIVEEQARGETRRERDRIVEKQSRGETRQDLLCRINLLHDFQYDDCFPNENTISNKMKRWRELEDSSIYNKGNFIQLNVIYYYKMVVSFIK